MDVKYTREPIITEAKAEKLNELFQDALSQHLFLFCHYKPIPENPPNYSARFITGVLNLFIFCCDSCFFLKDLKKIFNEYVFGDIIPNNIYKSIKSIKNISDEIGALRTAMAHNGTDSSERWYINWIKKELNNTYPPEQTYHYEKLYQKLEGIRDNLLQKIKNLINEIAKLPPTEKQKLINGWEHKTIEVYARQHNNRYRDQLKLIYSSQSGYKPNFNDLDGWINDSIGYVLCIQEKKCEDEKSSIEKLIANKEQALNKIKKLCEEYPDDESINAIKENAENDLSKHQEDLLKVTEHLNKTSVQIEEIKKQKEKAYKDGKTATDFFYSRVKDQMKQTLKEIKETEDSFTMYPECFIQLDIQKNFPPYNRS